MVDELSRGLAFRLAHSLQDPRFGNATEIIVDLGLPTGLDHIEPDRAGQNVSLIKASAHIVGRDVPLIVAVGWLVQRVDGVFCQCIA